MVSDFRIKLPDATPAHNIIAKRQQIKQSPK